MNRYTIRDYDKYLDIECSIYPHRIPIWQTKRIDESRGIVDDYLPIVDELYAALVNEMPMALNIEESYLVYTLIDYKLKQDNVFLGSCTVVVLTGIEGGDSRFDFSNSTISRDASKLLDAKFTIRIGSKMLNSENGKNEFYEMMAHELQHAYRYYNIFLSNNSYQDEEINKYRKYVNSLNLMKNARSQDEYDIGTIYYISETNEISSESNKLYEYIRNHEEINEANVSEYYNELPLYSIKESLSSFLERIDYMAKQEGISYINKIGEIFKRIINSNLSSSKAFIKFRGRVLNGSMFADRLFKRTISKAFDDFGRRVRMPHADDLAREMIESDNDFNLLKEILNRC
jgi:hypothetical protein